MSGEIGNNFEAAKLKPSSTPNTNLIGDGYGMGSGSVSESTNPKKYLSEQVDSLKALQEKYKDLHKAAENYPYGSPPAKVNEQSTPDRLPSQPVLQPLKAQQAQYDNSQTPQQQIESQINNVLSNVVGTKVLYTNASQDTSFVDLRGKVSSELPGPNLHPIVRVQTNDGGMHYLQLAGAYSVLDLFPNLDIAPSMPTENYTQVPRRMPSPYSGGGVAPLARNLGSNGFEPINKDIQIRQSVNPQTGQIEQQYISARTGQPVFYDSRTKQYHDQPLPGVVQTKTNNPGQNRAIEQSQPTQQAGAQSQFYGYGNSFQPTPQQTEQQLTPQAAQPSQEIDMNAILAEAAQKDAQRRNINESNSRTTQHYSHDRGIGLGGIGKVLGVAAMVAAPVAMNMACRSGMGRGMGGGMLNPRMLMNGYGYGYNNYNPMYAAQMRMQQNPYMNNFNNGSQILYDQMGNPVRVPAQYGMQNYNMMPYGYQAGNLKTAGAAMLMNAAGRMLYSRR
jgi:hypothetical protein